MALIECPNCHKKVSDSCRACIHCGAELRERSAVPAAASETDAAKKFGKLPQEEQDALRAEFLREYPKYEELEERGRDFKKLLGWTPAEMFVLVALMLIGRLWLGEEDIVSRGYFLAGACLAIVLFVKGLVSNIALFIAVRVNEKHRLIALKRFQDWLRKEKDIEYIVKFDTFTKRSKKYFDRIDLRVEPY